MASQQLARGFVRAGCQVHVVTSAVDGDTRTAHEDGIIVHRVRVVGKRSAQTATFLSMASFLVSGYRFASRLCQECRFDFINTHFAVPTGPLGSWLSARFKILNVLSIHGGDIYDPSKRASPHRWVFLIWIVRNVLRRADVVVAQSANTRDNAIRYYGPDRPIEIIPLPYEFTPFESCDRRQLNLDPGAYYVVGVGRLVARKDFVSFVNVVARLPDPWKGVIVGDGPDRRKIEEAIRHCRAEERVLLVGSVSDQDKFRYLSCADVFLLSSLHEGFGIVLQEAMQVGLPIVATDFGGQTDIAAINSDIELVSPGNIEQMRDAILEVHQRTKKPRTLEPHPALREFDVSSIALRYLRCLPKPS